MSELRKINAEREASHQIIPDIPKDVLLIVTSPDYGTIYIKDETSMVMLEALIKKIKEILDSNEVSKNE